MLLGHTRQVGKTLVQLLMISIHYFQADVQVYENLSEEAKDRLYLETLKRTVNISGGNRYHCIVGPNEEFVKYVLLLISWS